MKPSFFIRVFSLFVAGCLVTAVNFYLVLVSFNRAAWAVELLSNDVYLLIESLRHDVLFGFLVTNLFWVFICLPLIIREYRLKSG